MKRSQPPEILLVEDSESLAHVYSEYLKFEPVNIFRTTTGAEALNYLENSCPDVVLLDLMLPDMHGMEILKKIRATRMPTSVVIITAHGTIDSAVEAMALGAEDYLEKPFDRDRLLVTLRNVLKVNELSATVDTLSELNREKYEGFIGASLAMQPIYQIIENAADSKASIFITGESGTGKELCAQAIHARSDRCSHPFIAINCAAIPENLIESEIFGHKKGAFTGANAARSGAASEANGGTLFLDEIAELDIQLQAKLLRFVQSGSFQPVGSDKLETVDVRFVCATNRDPQEEVAAGRFREDLYYRLHVIPIHIPPLRDREDDAALIADHFLKKFATEEGKDFCSFDADAIEVIRQYSWPGNVRELQNIVRSAVVLNTGERITADMLPSQLIDGPVERNRPVSDVVNEFTEPSANEHSSILPLAQVEKEAVEQAIKLCGNNIPRAAAFLEVSPSTIYRKMRAWEKE